MNKECVIIRLHSNGDIKDNKALRVELWRQDNDITVIIRLKINTDMQIIAQTWALKVRVVEQNTQRKQEK